MFKVLKAVRFFSLNITFNVGSLFEQSVASVQNKNVDILGTDSASTIMKVV